MVHKNKLLHRTKAFIIRINQTDLRIDKIFYNLCLSISKPSDYTAGNTTALEKISLLQKKSFHLCNNGTEGCHPQQSTALQESLFRLNYKPEQTREIMGATVRHS